MRLSDEEIDLAESGDPAAISKVIKAYRFMTKSPLYDAIVSRLTLFGSWDQEIIDERPKILGSGEENDKGIERCRKYMIDQPDLVEATEKMIAKLTEDEADKINKDPRIPKGKDRVFANLLP